MSEKMAVIFGAGRISRAFLATLATRAGFQLTFVERAPILVHLLRERRRYKVKVINAPEKDLQISDFQVLTQYERLAVSDAVANADVVFVAIGGPNLPEISAILADSVQYAREVGREAPLNILVCENYVNPAQALKRLVSENLSDEEIAWMNEHIGFVETIVLSSCIDPSEEMEREDPLSLKAQDFWELQADAAAFVGEVPQIPGIIPKTGFQDAVVQKLFTFNCINAVIGYLGYLRGHRYLSDAALDPEVRPVVSRAAEESNAGLCAEYGFAADDQLAFSAKAIRKYSNPEMIDPIFRNTRDPIRKLSRHDRLIGPAHLALKHGIEPRALAQAIAAAFRYDHAEDPGSHNLQSTLLICGLPKAIERISGLHPDSLLTKLIVDAYEDLDEGWLDTPRRQARKAPSNRCL